LAGKQTSRHIDAKTVRRSARDRVAEARKRTGAAVGAFKTENELANLMLHANVQTADGTIVIARN
jgi:hypothetical protein